MSSFTAAIADQQLDLNNRTAKQKERFARFSALCLRAKVARTLLGLAHRKFCARLADSPLLQWFLHVGQVDAVKVFAKSTSQRFDDWVKPESMRRINDELMRLSCAPVSVGQSAAFDLPAPVVCTDAFFDTTVVKAPIHFPTDWVLLRDAARTLMKATICIRQAGLEGVESRNANTRERYIYIHGTNEEGRVGQTGSHGCVRMRNADVAELFDATPIGTPVWIEE